jgi:uncharacterized RDD family membrane protein YckC
MDPTAVVGRRVVAYIIDTIVVAVIIGAAWLALTKKVPGECVGGGVTINGDCRGFESGSSNRDVWILINFLASLIVFAILPGLRGTSPGKALVGIRVVSRDGGTPGIGRGIVRWLMYIADGFPWVLPMLVGFIAAATDSGQHRRLGDRVAGTLVVDKNAAGQPAGAVAPGAAPGGGGGPALGGGPAPGGGGPAPGWYPSIGSPRSTHATMPPSRLCASKPARRKANAAIAERDPTRHWNTSGLSVGRPAAESASVDSST